MKKITECVCLNILDADVAQLVEQLIRNQQVSGSIPLVGSKAIKGNSASYAEFPFLFYNPCKPANQGLLVPLCASFVEKN
jgi:hypothetical protein